MRKGCSLSRGRGRPLPEGRARTTGGLGADTGKLSEHLRVPRRDLYDTRLGQHTGFGSMSDGRVRGGMRGEKNREMSRIIVCLSMRPSVEYLYMRENEYKLS